MNKSRARPEILFGALEFGSLSGPRHQCLWNDTVCHKEKILKIYDNVVA